MGSKLVWAVALASAAGCALSESLLFRMARPPDTSSALLAGLWVAMPYLKSLWPHIEIVPWPLPRPAGHGHEHGHGHAAGHDHGHGHGPAAAAPAGPAPTGVKLVA